MRLLFTGDTAGNPEVDVSFYTTDEVMTSATRTPVTLAAGCRRTVLTKEDIQRSPRIRANEADTQPVADLFVVEAALRHELRKGILLMLQGEKLTDRQYIAAQTGLMTSLGRPVLIRGRGSHPRQSAVEASPTARNSRSPKMADS